MFAIAAIPEILFEIVLVFAYKSEEYCNKEDTKMPIRIINPQKEAQEIAIEEKLKQELERLKKTEPEITDALDVLQNLMGYTGNAASLVQSLKELAERVASGTLSEEDCGMAQTENEQLQGEIDRFAASSELAKIQNRFITNGELTLTIVGQSVSIPYREVTCAALGIDAGKVNISTPESATKAVGVLTAAGELLNGQSAMLDSLHNRVEHAYKDIKQF